MTKSKLDIDVSDLFFNHEHPLYDGLFVDENSNPTKEQQKVALMQDAEDFAGSINALTNLDVTTEELAEDFLERT